MINFKRYYINGNRFSVYVMYRTKTYRFSFENWWNTKMFEFTYKYFIVEETTNGHKQYIIYRRIWGGLLGTKFFERWSTKEFAYRRLNQLNNGEKED